MTVKLVLAMHGMPPKDFPEEEIIELVRLHRMHENAGNKMPSHLLDRYQELEAKIRGWPRTSRNDPFWNASNELAEELGRILGFDVVVGFNEFCAPTIADAIEIAAQGDTTKIIVTTPMMTPGGEHSEIDIPEAIEIAMQKHAGIDIVYAWPFSTDSVAGFLGSQVERFL